MVGGTRARKVDVRIVAATNRRLEDEVKAGRFREDLFYRLNVVRLHIPPLRERPEDVRLLAEHFMRTFATEQHKSVVGFTDDAARSLAAHTWPGNTRELQNAVLQAVVLADGDRLGVGDLQIPTMAEAPLAPARAALELVAAPVPDAIPQVASGPARSDVDAWSDLRERLRAEVEAAADARPRLGLPLGRWLAHELVIVAHEHATGVGARAAERLGLPQTTFARRLRQAETDRAVTPRPATWKDVRTALAAVVAAPDQRPGCLADRVDTLLLDVVLTGCPRRSPMPPR